MAIGNNMANFLTFSLRTKQALFEINKHSSKLYDSLKVKQIQCLRKIYENNDVIACLPTGYGKIAGLRHFTLLLRSEWFYCGYIIGPLRVIVNAVRLVTKWITEQFLANISRNLLTIYGS